MGTASELRKLFEKSIQRKLMAVAGWSYALLAISGFVILSSFLTYYLSGLVQSQNYSIAVQEWRGVTNGIQTGWNLLPPLNGICVVSARSEVLESQGICPDSTSIVERVIGQSAWVKYPTFQIRIHFQFSVWIVAILFPLLIAAIVLLCWFLAQRTLTLKSQLEVVELFKDFDSKQRELTEFQRMVQIQTEEIVALKKQALIAQIAAQVSHDIKSPVAALDMVVSDLTGLPEDKRILVRGAVARIKDISNTLLQKNREVVKGSSSICYASSASAETTTTQLLSSLIEGLISEKRVQHTDKSGIEITTVIDPAALGVFAGIQSTECKRVISNLVNNAVEVLDQQGKVTVSIATRGAFVEIRVQDNGRGIHPEILKKLGQRGETHGKAEGSGLGLYHARTSVESWGGSLRIESELGVGTSVIILLPTANAPEWFVPELKLSAGGSIAIMDDDPSVKEIWRQRFEQLGVQEHGIEVRFFSNPDELETWVKSSKKSKEALFLLDFEIIGNKRTGLDVAEQLGIGPQAILVSSRWEELNVQARCSKLGMRLIPKGLAGFVPIAIKRPLEKLHAVLLDDDSLVTTSWASVAKQNQKNIRSFFEPVSFFAALEEIDRASPVFIDSNLGAGMRGQDLVPRVREMGFTLVYLATGYEAAQFAGLPGLTAIVGKEAPPEIGGVVIDWSRPV